jgi:hypothetical protein
MFLNIINSPVFYQKHNVSETRFCLRFQVGLAHLLTYLLTAREIS